MLNAHHIRMLTDCTIQMRCASDLNALGPQVVEAISRLISSDLVVVSLALSHFPTVRFSYANHPGDWNQYAADFLTVAHEDPVYTARLRLLLDGAACATQIAGAADLQRTQLHQRVWRPLGVRRFLRFITPGRLSFRLEVGRVSDVAFTEADAEVLNAIGRHLDGATEALIERHRGRLPVGGELHPVQTFSWIVCDRNGNVLRTTAQGQAMMRSCAGVESAEPLGTIPNSWRQELDRRARGHAPKPDWHSVRGTPVSVHVAPIRPTPDEFSVGFLQRLAPGDPGAALAHFGLTRREADVLRWLSEGKTNAEIGVILGMSALTAKKHLENVFHKLSVENRTSAVVVALEAMRRAGQ